MDMEDEVRINDAENTSCSRIPGRQGLAKWACGQTASKHAPDKAATSPPSSTQGTGERRWNDGWITTDKSGSSPLCAYRRDGSRATGMEKWAMLCE